MENITTETQTTDKRTHMYYDANEDPKLANAKPMEKREAVVREAIKFALEQGCTEEDADKLRNALIGLPTNNGQIVPGALALITWRIHMCNVDAMVAARDEIWQPMSGKISVQSRNGQTYTISLRDNLDEQVTLGISIEKKGSSEVNTETGEVKENTHFWTYAAVVLQTKERTTSKGVTLPGHPFVLCYDVNAALGADGKTKVLTGGWSRSLYFRSYEDRVTGELVRENRLADLVRGGNDELVFMHTLIGAGFPVHTARINRNLGNRNGRWQARNQQQSEPRSLVGATAGVSVSAPEEDPFA